MDQIEVVTAAVAGMNLALLIILQLVFGKVIKMMWPLFFTVQLLIYQILYRDTFLPSNVLNFFLAVKGAIELDAIPKEDI
jgi:hypothetical protein